MKPTIAIRIFYMKESCDDNSQEAVTNTFAQGR